MSRSRSRDRDRKGKRSRSPGLNALALFHLISLTKEKEEGKTTGRDTAERAARKEREREKKAMKEEKRKKEEGGGGGVEWGKYGVISESDIFEKEEEFRPWLVEERFTNPETLQIHRKRDLRPKLQHRHPPNITLLPLRTPNGRVARLHSETYDARADEEALRKSFRRGRRRIVLEVGRSWNS
ncbi:hypothetical protein BT69DRAFT_720727 [Atractiella rhizophila]|nr:hypothetical protein BT69DRAFT_720727 [Atractiella rhizophila]